MDLMKIDLTTFEKLSNLPHFNAKNAGIISNNEF